MSEARNTQTPVLVTRVANGLTQKPLLVKDVGEGGGGNMDNPMTAAGDLIVGASDGVPKRLEKGSDGQVLKMNVNDPVWADLFDFFQAPNIRASLGGVYLISSGRTHNNQEATISSIYNAITNPLSYRVISNDTIYLPFEIYNFRYGSSSAPRDNTMTVKVKNYDANNGYSLIGYDFKNSTIIYINGIKENGTSFTTSYDSIQSLVDTNTWRAVYLGGSRMMGGGINTPDLDFVAGNNIGIRYDTGGHFTFRINSDGATQGQVLMANGDKTSSWVTPSSGGETPIKINIQNKEGFDFSGYIYIYPNNNGEYKFNNNKQTAYPLAFSDESMGIISGYASDLWYTNLDNGGSSHVYMDENCTIQATAMDTLVNNQTLYITYNP